MRALATEAGTHIREDYFTTTADSSQLYELEAYVRITRDMSTKLVRSDGIFYRIMYLLADETGTKWTYSADNEDVIGDRHEFTLNRSAAQKLVPVVSARGKILKCYHPEYTRKKESEEDALSSPAFRCKFHKKQNGGAESWMARDGILRELQETITNVLTWAGIPAKPDPTTFVEDEHFSVGPTDYDIELYSDPTPALEASQDALLMHVLGDLSGSARAVTERLATDGTGHYQEIAEDTGYSVRQIYRAANELSDIVHNDNGELSFISTYLKQEVAGIVDSLEKQVRSAGQRIAEIVDLERRQSADSALERWLRKYGAQFIESSGETRPRIDTVLSELRSRSEPLVGTVLEAGLDAWSAGGRDPKRFLDMMVVVEIARFESTTELVTPVSTLL